MEWSNSIKDSFLFIMLLLLSITNTSLLAGDAWTRKSDMPTARFGLTSSVVNGKIYAIGGATGPGVNVRTVEEYNPVTDTWTTKSNMPTSRWGLSISSVVNGRIYVVGGSGGPALSTVEEYNPLTDTWTRKADMPTARWALSTSAVNDKIYAIGGASNGVGLRTVEEYDPATNTWIRKADMPTPRILMSTSVVDGIIYAIGGCRSQGQSAISTVEAYDPATDTWTTKAPIPTARCFFSTCAISGKIFAVGGCLHPYNSGTFSSVEAYDPTTDTWTTMDDMPTSRKALATSVVNGKIYAIGGNTAIAFNTCISMVEAYKLIPPPPDFNGDGIVDISDLLQLIGSWGQDNPTVDIAPPPFGDSVVDALDLELLMGHWEQTIDDPTLIAHWAFDEAEGIIAYDSAGMNDAVVVGGTAWQPNDGQVDGALQLDGIDGCAIADQVLSPSNGPFSVLAWTKGGLPGQVVISGPMSANWLSTDILTGNLMTELKGAGRTGTPLQSQTLITDGSWHRIGFVWNGLNRTLYVDDFVVAEDTQNGLESSNDGLYIGCGKNMEPDTYWSGLIDDVRIYNRVVIP